MPLPVRACDQAKQELPRFTTFPLKYADATKSAEKLRSLLREGDAAVVPDAETNTVFIRARPEKIQNAKEILDRLDVGMPDYLAIIRLKHADAVKTVGTLQVFLMLVTCFDGDDRDIRITADERRNCIIIWASEERMQQAKEIVPWFDVKDK